MARSLLLILALASACDSPAQSAPDPKAAPSQRDADGKSAEPTAPTPAAPERRADAAPAAAPTPGVNDPVPPNAHVCERFGRARVGHKWTFQRKPIVFGEPTSFEDSGYTVDSYDLATHKLRMHHKRTSYMIDTTAVLDLSEDFRCDDQGMWFVQSGGDGTMTASADDKRWSTGQSTVYDPPMLVLPPVLEVGARWQAKSAQRHTTRAEGSPDREVTTQIDRSCEVKAKEQVTVPAGSFDALRVDCTDTVGGSVATIWYVDGVGAVKFGDSGPRLTVHELAG